MQSLVLRAGSWLGIALLAFLALAFSADTGFAVHMGIVMTAALIAMWATMQSADYGAIVICPLLSGPESLLFWIMKEFGNGQEAQAGRDYRQAA